MKKLEDYIMEANKANANFSLNISDIDKILYSLAFASAWSPDVMYEDYKELWGRLHGLAKKTLDSQNELPDNWGNYELAHRGSARSLD
jgi:hypothetical protein